MDGITRLQLGCACPGVPAPTPRARVEWIARRGFRAVQLDARAPGMRPRELDRSGRRDVAALLRRLELTLAGVDLLIPQEHFADTTHTDRAVDAATRALEFASEIASLAGGDPALTLTLPQQGAEATATALVAAAERCGTRIAELRWPIRSFEGPFASPAWGVALDPASALLAGDDPPLAVGRCGERLVSARVSDAARAARVPAGDGRLDLAAYRAALSVSALRGDAALDLEGVENPDRAAQRALEAWAES